MTVGMTLMGLDDTRFGPRFESWGATALVALALAASWHSDAWTASYLGVVGDDSDPDWRKLTWQRCGQDRSATSGKPFCAAA